jgi:predicted ATP-grasp superfamily ATP-dependent carboligase
MKDQTTHELEALLIGGNWPELAMASLGLLARAGFTVDVISTNAFLTKNRFMRSYFLAEKDDVLLKTASERIKKEYALIVVGDDPTLRKILNLDLPDDDKLKLIPVISHKNFGHIFSKIGLSIAFRQDGVRTPDYLIANNEHQLKTSTQALGYPLFIKLDSSAGGLDVYECLNDSDLDNTLVKLRAYPVLVQKKIEGTEISMEAFYQNGELIHFACSTQEKYTYKFGPTAIRRYTQLACLEKEVFDELSLIGKALGADGFVNMSSIRCSYDNKLYFFEADMRPNMWTGYSRYFGDDLANVIKRYFTTGETVTYPYPFNPAYPEQVLISHYSRISLIELVLNRYRIWRHLPENFLYITLRYKILAGLVSRKRKLYKRVFPKQWRLRFKNASHQLNICLMRLRYGVGR